MISDQQGLPRDIETIFERLATELAFLDRTWSMWKELFTISKDRVKLMNQLAPGFFALAGDALMHDVILRFCRLSDPPRTGCHAHLSLKTLVDKIGRDVYPGLRQNLERQLGCLRDRSASLRDYRNQKLTHTDLNVALSVIPPPVVKLPAVDESLQAIHHLMTAVWQSFVPEKTRHYGLSGTHHARAIITVLEEAKELRDTRDPRR